VGFGDFVRNSGGVAEVFLPRKSDDMGRAIFICESNSVAEEDNVVDEKKSVIVKDKPLLKGMYTR